MTDSAGFGYRADVKNIVVCVIFLIETLTLHRVKPEEDSTTVKLKQRMNNNDRINLIHRISELEGLTDRERSALLGLLRADKAYGLVWEDKPEAVEDKMREELPVLREVPERALISDDKDAPNHILIEGDNLEALTTLAYTHEGKIDVIYIDPPYNTGNKDFVYNDSFVDREDTYRHSKWLSFMGRRLRIAKQLLSDKGVIFISIDDNEQAQLKLLCDEVFGETQFISQFIWHSRQNKDNRNISGVSIDHEYIICYSKSNALRFFKGTERKIEQYSNPDNDPRGLWTSANMVGLATKEARPNLHYDLINPFNGINYGCPDKGWRYDKNTMSRLIKEERIIWPKDSKGRPRKKSFLNELSDILPGFSSLIQEGIYTNVATKEIKNIFNDNRFSFPKPTELISQLIQQVSNKYSTILDFFAGSGTTLHATMQLNAEDGGHRQCILVTNNENGICENVTYERNRRVICGYTTPKGEQVAGLTGNTLRYYKTDFVPREPNNRNKRALVAAATDLLCIKNDVYREQPSFGGRRLKPAAARYFDDGRTQMLIIYNELAVDAFVRVIAGMEVNGRIKVYVFSNNRYAYADNFESVADKVEVCALPAAIYDAYQKVLKPRKRSGNAPAADTPFAEETSTEAEQGTFHFMEEGGEA